MKKLILFLFVVFALFCLIGCGDDDDNNSSITGVDFTSDDLFEKLDYYLAIIAAKEEDEGSGIIIFSKKDVTSANVNINNTNIPIPEEWIYDGEDEGDFPYFIVVGSWMLPDGVSIEPGAVLDIKLKLNGTNFNNIMTVVNTPVLAEKEFVLTEDFTITWSLANNPMAQIVDLDGESDYWDENEDEDEFYIVKQLKGDARSHTFSKSNYSQFVVEGLEWYEYSVSAVNYKNFGKAMFMSLSADYVESGYDEEWKDGNNHKKLHRIVKILANK